jgi:hypothetical protein
MFWKYEIQHWFVQRKIGFIFLAVIAIGITTTVMTAEFINIGGHSDIVKRNAPVVLQSVYNQVVYVVMLLCSIFITSIANRDHASRMSSLVFVTPIRRSAYFFGRFLGGVTICATLLLIIHFAMALAPYMPWSPQDAYMAFSAFTHVHLFLTIGLPFIFLIQGLVYAFEMHFPGKFCTLYIVFSIILLDLIASRVYLLSDMQAETIGALLTPLNGLAQYHVGRFFNAEMMNTSVIPLSGLWLIHLLLWSSIVFIVFTIAYFRFSLTTKNIRPPVYATKASEGAIPTKMPTHTLTKWKLPSVDHDQFLYKDVVQEKKHHLYMCDSYHKCSWKPCF